MSSKKGKGSHAPAGA